MKVSEFVSGQAKGLGSHQADQKSRKRLEALASRLQEIEKKMQGFIWLSNEEVRLLAKWQAAMYRESPGN